MKNPIIVSSLIIFSLITICMNYACNKPNTPIPEQENMNAALMMDAQIDNLHLYHDSVLDAQLHNPGHVHHYDSIFHHHDSIYHHHHNNYHHGDTTHHHTGWHHTPVQHHHHDSLLNHHHIVIIH